MPPCLPATCPKEHEPGYTVINAEEYGVPTSPTYTQGLDQDERRKRLIIYMVRYNRIEKWMMLNISNTGLSKKEYKQELEYYERTRKDLQAQAVGNSIPANGEGGWFIRHILWALSEDNFRVHLFNLRLNICRPERFPNAKPAVDAARRLSTLSQIRDAYESHKIRWLGAIQDAINKEHQAIVMIPLSNQANDARVRDIRSEIYRLRDLEKAASDYKPLTPSPQAERALPPMKEFYAERGMEQQWQFLEARERYQQGRHGKFLFLCGRRD